MTPIFLATEQVLAIHQHQIEQYGGSLGVRDAGMLESALSAPKASFGGEFLHSDLFLMAAAYVFHITKDHAFVDGNKRTAAIAALYFFELNGHAIEPNPEEYEELVRRVAVGGVEKDEIASFFRRCGCEAT